MADIQVYKRVIDYAGLNAKPIPERSLALFRELNPVLALLQGMGSDGAKLVSVDGSGNLNIALPAAPNLSRVAVVLGGINGNDWAVASNVADANAGGSFGAAAPSIFNNASYDRQRSASAANLAAQSGLGAALTALPGQWVASSNPGAGTAASASRAAGGAGVRHVCTGGIIVLSATTALAGITTVTFNFRDGASGAGTILFTVQVTLPAAVVPAFSIPLPPLNLVGSANTAMTLEGSAAVGNLMESATLFGYDAS
jgi:hypothetical protein